MKKSFAKVMYKKYGILLKESEVDFFNIIFGRSNNLYEALNDFCNNCETRYFQKNKVNEIKKEILKEETARNKHTPQGKGTAPNGNGPAGNITNDKILSNDEGIYIEDTVNTATGEEAVYIEDENKNKLYKDMDAGYVDIFTRNIRNKNINK